MRHFCSLPIVIIAASLCGQPSAARPLGEATDRCLTYGFRDQDRLARCTELEVNYPTPKHWRLKDLNRASNQCLRLGYAAGDRMGMCIQRHLRPELADPAR